MDEEALADKLYATGKRCLNAHICSFPRPGVPHISASWSYLKLIIVTVFWAFQDHIEIVDEKTQKLRSSAT